MPESEPRGPDAPPGLNELYADRAEPPDLEDRIVADLVARGRLVPGRPAWRAWTARAAAALLVFASGWGAATMSGATRGVVGGGVVGAAPTGAAVRSSAAAATAGTFMLLLWEEPGFAADAPAGSHREEYAAWAMAQIERGIPLSGAELGLDRATLGPPDGAPLPRGEAILGGYFMVSVESAEEARALAQAHPHLAHGGWIEVVPVGAG